MVSSKKLYLSLLTGVIFSSIITLNCQTEAGEQEDPNSLNSSIIGQLDGIPIGSTVKYVWKDQVLKTTTVCTVSERAPEAGDTQDSKCWIQPHGGWAVPPMVSSSDYFPTGGTEKQELGAATFKWHGGHHPWIEVGYTSATVSNGVYQGTSGLAGGGLWGDFSWEGNEYGWGKDSPQASGSYPKSTYGNSSKSSGKEDISDFGNFSDSGINNRSGSLDLNGGKASLPWNTDSSFNGGSGGGSFGDLVNDSLNDKGGSFKSNGKTGSYQPNNASQNDWTSSGSTGGSQNLDDYFNSGGYPNGTDSPTNMPDGLTNDLFGFDTTPVNPPSWFDKSQFLDKNNNIKPEILKQMKDENFWLDGKEPGTINGQQMWDFYENAAGMSDMSGGLIYDQNGNPINGFFDANGNPIDVFFDENGNFVDANGNPIKVYDRYGNEITGLFDRDGKRINSSLFKDVNGDGVIDINDLTQQLADKNSLMAKLNGKDGLQAVLDSIFGDDKSLNKTVQGTLSTQDMYALAKQILLNAGFDIDDIMNGRNYSEGSSYTDPSDAWDFNRITTLMKARKITPVTPEEIREHQENRRKALAKKGIGGFGAPISAPSEDSQNKNQKNE